MENNIICLEDVVQNDSGLFDYYSLKAWDEMIDEYDASWFTQTHESLMGLVSCGRMRLNSFIDQANQQYDGILDMTRERIEISAACAAACARDGHKEFDMKVYYQVPGTTRKDYVLFNGWKLVHFEKIYKFDNGRSSAYYQTTNWDFVLGEDGEIYHVTSGYAAYDNPSRAVSDNEKFFYIVRKAIYYDVCILKNKNQAYFIAVSHGAFLTIGGLLRYPKVVSGDFSFKQNYGFEEYFFNFPLQPNDKEESGIQHIYKLLSSFLPSGMAEEDVLKLMQELQAEKRAKLEQQKMEELAKEQKRQERIQKERERLDTQRQAEEAETKRREKEAHEQSVMKAKQRVNELEQERKDIDAELVKTHGIFSVKKRLKLQSRLDSIDKEIKCLQDL